MPEITGDYYPPGLSRRTPARMHVDARQKASFHSADGELLTVQDLPSLQIAPRLGNTPRLIELDNGARFETRDNEAIDELLGAIRQQSGQRLLHRMERHLPLVLLFTALVALFMVLTIAYGIPGLSRSIAFKLSPETNLALGKGTLELLDRSTFGASELSPQRQQQLLDLFRQYTDRYPQWHIRPILRKGNDIGANALALPGGEVVFTDELVTLAEDDRELLAILGHEIGHLEQRHLMRRVLQSSFLTLVVVFVTGDISTVSSIVYGIPTLLMELKYSRAFEQEADDFAFSFMQQNHLAPIHFAHIMRRLERYYREQSGDKSHKDSAFLSTHPPTEERIRRFETNPDENA